ncbi:MAG: UDP-N-acetylmuramoyl-L-alanyl-D-glutamate--2,6-diaminopimelate ligase [Gammaproteobacteria bacterium]
MMQPNCMSLDELFSGIGVDIPPSTVSVNQICASSRRVTPGSLFLALAGASHHGLQYLQQALSAGAVAVAWEPAAGVGQVEVPDGIAAFPVPGLSGLQGRLADCFYRAPSTDLKVTGITGTNGKTTVAWLVSQALTALGQRAAYSGTLGFGLPGALEPASLTTPGCVEVHRRLRQFADDSVRHAVMEVSSHALDQGRVDEVRFAVTALTNISRDHLDYHGDMDRYVSAKSRLFLDQPAPVAVINMADERARALGAGLGPHTDLIGVALLEPTEASPAARLIGSLVATRRAGIGVELTGDFGQALIESQLWGRFNAENLVVAAGILIGHGVDLASAAQALASATPPPGRLERLVQSPQGPDVVVDFAHSPEALKKALLAVREHCDGNVWCVFGCGGDRDTGKRAPMGGVASALADHVLLTDDNPRGEDPDAIIASIRAGTSGPGHVEVIRDRAHAIRHAVRNAALGDAVLIAGKGHELVQIEAGRSLPFSDREVARTALEKSL